MILPTTNSRNNEKYFRIFLISCILLIFNLKAIFPQNFVPIEPQKLTKDSTTTDNLKAKKKGDLDTLVVVKGRDSIVYNKKNNILKIYGNADLVYRTQKLQSHYIELDMDKSQMEARPFVDSSGKISNFPIFNDKGEEFYGKIIKYNFKSQKGSIDLGETQMEQGFYFGDRIKRVSPKELFVENGCYTTCEAPHPHYYFGSPKMKVVTGDKVFVDPLIFYVQDMPIFIVPFGFYLPNKTGRQSGLIVPSYFFSSDRGVILENLGFYWAASDYWDTQIGLNLYSKGGFTLKNSSRIKVGNDLNSNVTFQYGYTRSNPLQEYTQNWSLAGSYNQTITPMQNINGTFNFSSKDFNRNTQVNLQDRVTQNISSNIAYSRSFENGTSSSISYQRNQNIITDEYSQRIPISYNIPNLYPLKSFDAIPKDSWLRDISFSLNTTGNYSQSSNLEYKTVQIGDTSVIDTSFKLTENKYISYNPSLSISPKFGYFTVTPNISFAANTFFRRTIKSFNEADSSIMDTYQNGLFWEYWYSFGISTSTKLYGMWDDKHRLFGFIKSSTVGLLAFRHTYNPSISFRFSPDFGNPNYGFYDTYYNPLINQYVQYSRFVNEGGSHSPGNLTQSLSYSDMHSFEVKIKTNDSLGEKKLELLRLNFGTGYNFGADSLRLSPLSMQFRSPALDFLNFTGSANFTFYDEDIIYDNNGLPTNQTRFVDRFLLEANKFPIRLTNLSMSFSTSFSNTGGFSSGTFGKDVSKTPKDSIAPGERFSQRLNEEEELFDFFGDSFPGYSPMDLPWSVNFAVSYNYSRYSIKQINQTFNLNANLSLDITKTWKLTATSQFDIITGEILTPYFTITKDLHCWNLLFTWSPSPINGGFYLKFGIKAPQLQDLKLEKRSNPLYR